MTYFSTKRVGLAYCRTMDLRISGKVVFFTGGSRGMGRDAAEMLAAEGALSASHVRPELVEWLASRPLRHDLEIGGKQLVMTHASPLPPHNQYVVRARPS